MMKPEEKAQVSAPKDDNKITRAEFLTETAKSIILIGAGAAG